jgi:hypothetical protein
LRGTRHTLKSSVLVSGYAAAMTAPSHDASADAVDLGALGAPSWCRRTGKHGSRKTFVEVTPATRLAYLSLIDFVPDHEPYEHLTVVDITPQGDRTRVVMTVDPMHDQTWSERILAGRKNENLEAAIARRAQAPDRPAFRGATRGASTR